MLRPDEVTVAPSLAHGGPPATETLRMANRRRAEALIASGAMTAAGMAKIEAARANGEWDKALEDRVDRPLPEELEAALAGEQEAATGFDRLTPTQRKYFIHWIAEAKRPDRAIRLQSLFHRPEVSATAPCRAGRIGWNEWP